MRPPSTTPACPAGLRRIPNAALNDFVGPDGTGGVAFDSASWANTATAERLLEPGELGERLLGERELGVGFVELGQLGERLLGAGELGVGFVELGQLGPGLVGRGVLELGQLGPGLLGRVGQDDAFGR